MIAIEPISPKNVSVFKAVRLWALGESPAAFGSTYACESQLSDAEWLERVAQFTGAQSVGYLAMDAQTACGLVRATVEDHDSVVAWVESMWVAPWRRKTGIGRLLVGEVLAWARGRGIRALKLSVTSNNDPAIHFYQGLGFVRTGKTEPYPCDPALVECEMLLALS